MAVTVSYTFLGFRAFFLLLDHCNGRNGKSYLCDLMIFGIQVVDAFIYQTKQVASRSHGQFWRYSDQGSRQLP